MSECFICKKQKATTECPQCHNQVCPDCLIDGKCSHCFRRTLSDSTGMTEQQIIQSLHPGLMKWNWGAFGCSFVWAAAMKRWGWFVLTLITLAASFIMPMNRFFGGTWGTWFWIAIIYLGMNGTRIAWQSREWKSFEQFIETQKVWGIWGKAIFATYILVTILIVLVVLPIMHHD